MSKSNVVGATAVAAIGALLLRRPEIIELALFTPAPVPPAQERIPANPERQRIIDSGLETRQRCGLPFWDAVLLSTFGQGRVGFPIIEKALFHNPPTGDMLTVRSSDWSEAYLNSIMRNVTPGRSLVLSSLAKLNTGESRHIPFVDFHCPSSALNEDLCSHASSLLDPGGGYLLESGRSYHFYGKSLLTASELPSFLGRALLLSPVVDRAWVAHQLIEGACGLRISEKFANGKAPIVVRDLAASELKSSIR